MNCSQPKSGPSRAGAIRVGLFLALVPLVFAAARLADWEAHFPTAIALSPDGKTLATAYSTREAPLDADCRLEVRDLDANRRLALEQLPHLATCLAFSRDGSMLAAGLENGEVRVWRLGDNSRVVVHQIEFGCIRSVEFNGDDSALVVGGEQGMLLLSAASGEKTMLEQRPGEKYWRSVLSPDGARLAVVAYMPESKTAPCHVYDVTDAGFEHRATTNLSNYAVLAWMPDSGRVVIGNGPQVLIWDVAQQRTSDLATAAGNIYGVAVLHDGATIVTGGEAQQVELWEAATGRHLGTLSSSEGYTAKLARSTDGTMLAATIDNGRVEVWDTATQRRVGVFSIDRWPLACAWLYLGLFVAWFAVWVWMGVEPNAGSRPMWDAVLLCGMVLGVLLIRIFATPPPEHIHRWPYPIFLGSLGAITSLLLVWAMLGSWKWSLRAAGFLAGAALIGAVPIALGGASNAAIFECAVSAIALIACLALILLGLRWWGLCIVQINGGEVRVLRDESARQFSLRDILLWTAAAALFVAVARFLSPYWFGVEWLVFLLVNGAYVAVTAAFAALAGLSARRLVAIPLALGVAVVCGWAPPWPMVGMTVLPDWWYILMQLAAAVLIMSVLAVFRAHGYRWRRLVESRAIQEELTIPQASQ